MTDRPPADASDGSLVRRLRDGQGDAATLLYLRYAEQLRSLATGRLGRDLLPRLDADDIVQSVFRTFFRRAGGGQYDVPAGGDLWKLFLVIALNKIRNAAAHHRAACRDVRKSVDPGDAPEPASPDGLAALRMVVAELMDGLPDSHRAAVEARIEGYEVAEIAARVGRSKRSVERILCEFRSLLEQQLGEGDGDAADQQGDGPADRGVRGGVSEG